MSQIPVSLLLKGSVQLAEEMVAKKHRLQCCDHMYQLALEHSGQ